MGRECKGAAMLRLRPRSGAAFGCAIFADCNDPPPGFVEADLVAHCGPSAKGSYVQTLTLTDIATGWTECAPLLGSGAKTPDRGSEHDAPPNAIHASGFRYGQRQCVHERETVKRIVRTLSWCSRAAVRIARTIRPGSSRRTAPWSDGLSDTGVKRGWRQLPRWHGCTRRCGCS
jgi:hypothetical protein